MTRLILQRLYLTARLLAAILAVGVVGWLAVAAVHDHVVQRADARCFERQLAEGIARAQKNAAEVAAQACTPEVVEFLGARARPTSGPAGFDPDAFLARSRKLSPQEEACFWARRGAIVGLSNEETSKIAGRCGVQFDPWAAPPTDAERAGRVDPASVSHGGRLVPDDDLPDYLKPPPPGARPTPRSFRPGLSRSTKRRSASRCRPGRSPPSPPPRLPPLRPQATWRSTQIALGALLQATDGATTRPSPRSPAPPSCCSSGFAAGSCG